MAYTYGVDVSHWQGDIDWKMLYAFGVRFAFVKCSQADWKDDRFNAHWSAAKAAGMMRGAYHFMTWNTPAVTQARTFLNSLGNDIGELPPVCDYEWRNRDPVTHLDRVPGAVVMSGMLRGWTYYVEQAVGKPPFIYTGMSFWKEYGTKAEWVLRHPLWLGYYDNEPQPTNYPPPTYLRATADTYTPLPWGRNSWTIWQFSDRGRLPGYSDNLDLDVFNGSEAQLRQQFGLGMPGTVVVPDDALAILWAAHPELHAS